MLRCRPVFVGHWLAGYPFPRQSLKVLILRRVRRRLICHVKPPVNRREAEAEARWSESDEDKIRMASLVDDQAIRVRRDRTMPSKTRSIGPARCSGPAPRIRVRRGASRPRRRAVGGRRTGEPSSLTSPRVAFGGNGRGRGATRPRRTLGSTDTFRGRGGGRSCVPEDPTPQTSFLTLWCPQALVHVWQPGACRQVRAASGARRAGWHEARRDQQPVPAQGGKLSASPPDSACELLIRDRVIAAIGEASTPGRV